MSTAPNTIPRSALLRRGIAIVVLATAGWLGVRTAPRMWREHRRRTTLAPCAGSSWSTPRVATTLPPGAFLRSPTLADVGGRLYVSGILSLAGRTSAALDTASLSARVFGVDGTSLGLPTGQFRFENAHLLSDGDARLHLIWGERGPQGTRSTSGDFGPPVRVKSLWHSVFVPGTGWSPARLVLEDRADRDGLLWNSENSSVAVAASGRVHLVVPRVNRDLLHLSYNEGAWLVDSVPVKALYAAIVERRDGERDIAYIGADRGHSRRYATLYFIHSKGPGDAWSRPEPIEGLERFDATRPRLLMGADGVLHLMWGSRVPGTLLTTAVRHSSSEDGGRTWSERTELPLPREPFTKWRAGLDQCNNPHVLVSTWTRLDSVSVGRVLHSALGLRSWTPYSPLPISSSVREIEISSDTSGELHLVASVGQLAPADSTPTYAVALAELGPSRTGTR